MKLHDLKPAPGSHTARTRVGRGIAAGKGKTAGRGTKGQKARAGGSIPPWFEGGQTPLHMRIPKLRGFKNRFKVEYEVVNVGAIAAAAERGAFEAGDHADSKAKGATPAPSTVNQDILRAVGLVRTLNKPLKILGAGELSTALFVVADAFTKSAREKIESAGGTVSVLEVPTESRPALGVGEDGERRARQPRTAAGRDAASREATAKANRISDAAERASAAEAVTSAKAGKAGKGEKGDKVDKAEASATPTAKREKADPSDEPTAAAGTDTGSETAPESTGSAAGSNADADASAEAAAVDDSSDEEATVAPDENA